MVPNDAWIWWAWRCAFGFGDIFFFSTGMGREICIKRKSFLSPSYSFSSNYQQNMERYKSWEGPCKNSAQFDEKWGFWWDLSQLYPNLAEPRSQCVEKWKFFIILSRQYLGEKLINFQNFKVCDYLPIFIKSNQLKYHEYVTS